MSSAVPPVPASAAASPLTSTAAAQGATRALVVLTAMNLLNYVDRYVPSAVKDLFKEDLGLTDAETSLPLTAFVVVYMLASPIFGALADKVPRRVVIAAGVALWSLATGMAAFATGFWTFLAARALVGVGEAAYATISPALLADFYPESRRNRALTAFYVAIPLGAALGFVLGGWLGAAFGWRTAFMAVGFPGLIAAAAVLMVPEPERGAFDDPAQKALPSPTWAEAIATLRRTRPYVYAVCGYVLVTFASGALADWMPAYLSRLRGLDLAEAGSLVGTATVVGGLGGTIAGGAGAEWLQRRGVRSPYLLLSGVTMLLASLVATAALLATTTAAITAAMIGAQLLLWCYNGPINTVLINSVPSTMRARAFSLSILAIHLFGDAISPPIVGLIADVSGSLALGMALVPVALFGGGAVWLIGVRRGA
jgi:MFS family permease